MLRPYHAPTMYNPGGGELVPEIEYREFRAEDADSWLRLHDSTFPPMAPEYWRHWRTAAPVTAAVAVSGGEVVGTVPFVFRDFLVRPGVAVRVAWEYSVCVREDLRGSGVGSRLMRTAKEFLRGRCQAMMVYREDERSPAYGFYSRNGHHDLAYLRTWVHHGELEISGRAAQQVSWDEFLSREPEYLTLFRSTYGSYGGYPPRHEGYYGGADATPQYAEIPLALTVLERRDRNGVLEGYAIIGEERLRPTLHLMEVATREGDTALALPLLAAHARLAAARGIPAVASLPDSSPYAPVLAALGFRPVPRSQGAMMIMMHALDPESLSAAAWLENDATGSLDVLAFTPQRDVVLHRAMVQPARQVRLEMKEDTLTRLLACRLDLKAAVAQESVTAVGARTADVDAIAQALAYSPWAYHYLDFV